MASSSTKAAELACCVCTDSKPRSEFPQDDISADCVHRKHMPPEDTAICHDCLKHALEDQIDNKRPVRIQCPICSCTLTYYEVQKWVTTAAFRRYDAVLVKQATTGDNAFVQCVNPRCNSGQIHEGGTDFPLVTCVRCGATTCFNHQNLPWHEGMLCREFDHANEAARRYGAASREIRDRLRAAGVDPDNNPDAGINRHRPGERQRLADMLQRYRNASALLEDAEERRESSEDQPTQPAASSSTPAAEPSNSRPQGRGGHSDLGQPGPSRSGHQKGQGKDNFKDTAKQGEQTVKMVSKKCPKCRAPTQRGSGCPHMRCQCGHDWCWKCLQQFDPDNVMDHARCFTEDADEQLAVQQRAGIDPRDIRPPRPQNAFDAIFNHPVFFQPPVELNPADPPDAPDRVRPADANNEDEDDRPTSRPRDRRTTRPRPPASITHRPEPGSNVFYDDFVPAIGRLSLNDRPFGSRASSPPRGLNLFHDDGPFSYGEMDEHDIMNAAVRRNFGLPPRSPRRRSGYGYGPEPSPFGGPPCHCPPCPDCSRRHCSGR